MLAANRLKKGYYVRHVKEGLWATFGISKIKPFNEHDTKDQMKQWKQDSRKAYKDLYNPNDPTNPNSDTFLASIVQYVFVSEDEQTHMNAIWTQAILEIIFDEHYLSAKIDSEVIDMWFQ